MMRTGSGDRQTKPPFRPQAGMTLLLAVVTTSLAITGCVRSAQPAVPMAAPGPNVGVASWYGHPYHGRRAASGEIYDMNRLTAAHRTLPFGTHVRVRNIRNAKSVVVRINDRGPFVDNRMIDLSRAAARSIGMLRSGITPVELEILGQIDTSTGFFAVQVGAFESPENAERLRREMDRLYGHAEVFPRPGKPVLWRVLAGKVSTIGEAHALAATIQSGATRALTGAFVVRLDEPAP